MTVNLCKYQVKGNISSTFSPKLQHSLCQHPQAVFQTHEEPPAATAPTRGRYPHQALGDHDRAVELYQQALTIFEAVYGPDHPSTVKVRRLL